MLLQTISFSKFMKNSVLKPCSHITFASACASNIRIGSRAASDSVHT